MVQDAEAHQHARLREELAIAERDLADVGERATRVEIEPPRRDRIGHHRDDLVLAQLHGIAVLGDHAGKRIHSRSLGGPRVCGEHAVFAVDRDEAPGADEIDHHPLLTLAGVAAGVHQLRRAGAARHHPASAPYQVVDDVAEGPVVPGDHAAGEDHQIVLLELHGRMLAEREPRQRAARLALRTGAEDDELPRRKVPRRLRIDERIGRAADVAEVEREAHVGLHRSPEQDDLPVLRQRRANDALDAVDVRAEHRHHHAALRQRTGEDPDQRLAHLALAGGRAFALGVGRIGEQTGHAGLAQLREPPYVEELSIHRAPVDLEIAGVDHQTRLGEQGISDGVRDAVRYLQGLEVDVVADHSHRPRLDGVQVRGDSLLGQLFLHHRQREPRAADRRVGELAQQVMERADVVFVRVRQQDGVHLAGGPQIREIRSDHLHAERLLGVGEHEAAVDHDPVAAGLDDHAVHPDLAEAAERNDADRSGRRHRRIVPSFGLSHRWCPIRWPKSSILRSSKRSATAKVPCSSWRAPAPARPACSRTGSRTCSASALPGRPRSWRSRSRTRPRESFASG